jgi:hypothetical protein
LTKDVQLRYTTKPLRFDADLCQVQGKIYQSFREQSGVSPEIDFFLQVLLILQDNRKLLPDLLTASVYFRFHSLESLSTAAVNFINNPVNAHFS